MIRLSFARSLLAAALLLCVPAAAQGVSAVKPSSEVLEIMLEIRNQGNPEAALKYLSDELDRRARFHRFAGLYVAVWQEAQVRSGRMDSDWAASLYNQLFISCEKHKHFTDMDDVMGNLLNTLGSSGRHGRKKEILEWWAHGQRAAGERLDASKYRDRGPALPYLPEVRMRAVPEEILYWRANADKGVPKQKVHLGQMNAQLFENYADHFGPAGKWEEAMEWTFIIHQWASHEDGKPKWQLIQPWFRSVESISHWLSWHGYYEESLEYVEEGLAAPMQESYHGRCNITFNIERLMLLMDLGREPDDVVEKVAELAERAAANRHLGIGSHRWARVAVAKAMLHKGRDQEALAILNELADLGFRSARTRRLIYWLDKKMYDRVEEELISLLNDSRKAGNKSSEAWLYEKYADFLEAVGRLDEALAMRREVIRLYKSFNHFTKVPIELAKLALLLERMGDAEGAKAVAAEARALLAEGRLPKTRLKKAQDLLGRLGQSKGDDDDSGEEKMVDFQPESSIVIPIEGAGWTTLLTLTNPSGKAEEGTLSTRGMPLKMATEGEQDEVVIRPVKEGRAGEDTFDLRLDPKTYELIRITAADKEIGKGEITVVWTSKDGERKVEAVVDVEGADEGVSTSIIQAGNYRANPFYSVPMYFHYVTTDDSGQTTPMRFVASKEARVEVYALDGTPLLVDAQGNGSLWDRGDELFGAGDGQGNLQMPLKEGAVSFMVLVFPKGELPKEGLNLDVEIQHEGKWIVNSQNRLIP